MNMTTQIIRYESDELTDIEVLELFAELIKTGMAWKLQGAYGRMAIALINAGYIDRKGNIMKGVTDNE